MTLPGFTAEDSLYRTSGHYRTFSAHESNHGMINPAQLDKPGRVSNNRTLKKVCLMGTSCVPDPKNPSCQICTDIDENCNKGLSWYDCTPRLQCSPLTFCNPDPLNPFCNICTQIDENCQKSTYQYCIGVPIPNKIPINVPDPVVGLTR